MTRTEKILLLVLGSLALLSLGGAVSALEPPILAFAASGALTAGLLAMLAFGVTALPGAAAREGPRGWARRLGLGPGRLSAGAVAILAAGTLALSQSLEAAIDLAGLGGQGALAAFERALVGVRGPLLGAAVLGLGLAPPVGEELFFRGLVQRGLERRLEGRSWAAPVAVGVAAVLFGAAHLDPIHAGAAVVLGLYLGSVAWVAGSVRASIACHTANNLVAVVGSAFAWNPVESSPVVVAGGLAGAGAALLVALRMRRVVVHALGEQVPPAEEDPEQGAPQQ